MRHGHAHRLPSYVESVALDSNHWILTAFETLEGIIRSRTKTNATCQDAFHQEGSMEAFDRAMEDTLTAINTGCLRELGTELSCSNLGVSLSFQIQNGVNKWM